MKKRNRPFGSILKTAVGILPLALGVLTVISPATAAVDDFRVTRLGERLALFQTGRESTTNITVLASKKGLVVIDTGVLPSRGAALRAAIEKEFGRQDFAYVINTHSHFDHIGGNQAFAGLPIIAHRNAALEMGRSYQGPQAIEAFLRARGGYQARLQADLKKAAAGSREAAGIQEQLDENAALMADYRQGRFILTLPTLTFEDRMPLDLGDLKANLIYFGRDHTGSDILVHVPELRLLVVGDLFGKDWLPSFQSPQSDVPRWFQALDSLPAGAQAVERVICGHDEMMTGDEFRAQTAYLRDIWDGVAAARREGATLAAVRQRFPFEKRYPALAGLPRMAQGRDQHIRNIEAAWRLQSEPAGRALESLIAARGLEAAVVEYRKSIAGNERYSVSENELNALGYRYLQTGKMPEALAVFTIISEAFPRSWNAWDSLAEACLMSGEEEKAGKFYAKSVELNPENQNGKVQLSRIQGTKLNAAGETKEPLRFAPGGQTGLQGPYLGQKAPGLKAELFAPGIVSSAEAMEFAVTFTPDGKEMYFTRRKNPAPNTIFVCRWEKDGWTAPREAAFSIGFPSNEPFITPDGSQLFFGSNRPKAAGEKAEYAIWVVDRTADGGWSAPRQHGPGMFVSTARNGNLYLTDVMGSVSPERPVIVYPRTGDRYAAPQRVGGGVNTPAVADHGFIAPDESYILFDSTRPGGQGGEGDLYVCFKKADGVWSEAFNLGDAVNSPATNFCPSVSPDGKYIFLSTCRDIYWVSAEILAPLKAKALRDINESVRIGDLAGVKEMLAEKPERLNGKDAQGWTPLIHSIMAKNEAVFQYLLAAGADVNLADRQGLTPLFFISYFGLDGWIEPIILQGAKIDSPSGPLGSTPLLAAVKGGHQKSVDVLLAKGAHLDIRDLTGDTPLLLAARDGRTEIVRLLLAKGASQNEKDAMGSTPLHLAALNGDKALVEFLISKGAPLDEKNMRNGTPISIAIREGHGEVVRMLQAAGAKKEAPPVLKGEYLGMKKPGMIPEVFAPGIVSTEKNELNSVFTPDGKEFYFTIESSQGKWTIMVMKRKTDQWTKPQPASFSGTFSDVDLFISPDGKKLYYCSNRPLDGKGAPAATFDIWVVDRIGEEWSAPKNMGAPINSAENEFYPSVTKDGTMYFQSRRPDTRGPRDIYRARLENGVYAKVENLGDVINSDLFEGDGLISPDEDFLIYSVNRPGGFGLGDLYISYRDTDGGWSKPLNMGDKINTKSNENCPILSPDGKFLFYTSGNDIYWVSAKVIDELRPKTKSAPAARPLELTYIANAGVLLSSGGSKVLIDALFDKPNPEYRAPSPEVLDKIMKGTAPFDGIDLVLVTHNHPDHFDPKLAARYMETSSKAVMLAPADAVAEMRKAAADWAQIESRIIALELKVGESAQRDVKGFPITAFRTLHDVRDAPMNLMFLFELNGRRIFHEGDSDGKPDVYRGFGLGSAPLDLALVHFWFPLEPNIANFLIETMKPAHVALTHLPIRSEGDWPAKIDQVRKSYKDIFLLLPGLPVKALKTI
jgi:ankyrin repeat protein/glyoxylase-like metal-dependent hydrolase (beta-lactamase superfamily II)